MRRFLPLLFILTMIATAGARQRSASITAIAPTFGAPGTTVSIRGSGFSGFEAGSWAKDVAGEPPPGAVEFNGIAGDVLFWRDDLISVKVPKGASTGPIRIILFSARLAITGDEFDVYYSTGEKTPATREVAIEPSRRAEDSSRNEERVRRYYDQDREAPETGLYVNPWFSLLSPGERTFLGEQGFTNTFLFGNPFSHGRSFPFGDGFNSRRGDFGHSGFERFGYQTLFRDFSFRRSRNVRPFWFFRFR